MKLYLLRHGIAEEGAGMPDAQRQLTEEGRRKLRRVMKSALAAGVQPDQVLSSPYARARQTAAIAVEELGYRGEIIESASLTPFGNPHQTWEEVRAYRRAEQLLLVGHNPHLSSLSCMLLGAPGGALEMRKGGLACFELISAGPQARASLSWLMTPKSVGI